MMYACHYTFSKSAECTAPRVSHSVNYGCWVMMMCQCRLVLGKKCPSLARDVGKWGDDACMWAGGT